MYESGYKHVVSEDTDKNHITTLRKSSLQQYKLSLQKSNQASNVLLQEAWQANYELLNDTAVNTIINSAKALLTTEHSENCKTWESSLSKYDPEAMFNESIQRCTQCTPNPSKYDINLFNKNNCTCALGSLYSATMDNRKGSKKEVFTKHFSEGSSQESTSGDEKMIIPKLGKPRTTGKNISSLSKNPERNNFATFERCNLSFEKCNSNSEISEKFNLNSRKCNSSSEKYNSYPDPEVIQEIVLDKEEEENRAHKSNVAKITFKTAKEQLLASNPGAKRTLGASRKAQGKFVSPMIGAQEKQESREPTITVTDERLKHIDPKMIEMIESEIIDKGTPIGWEDIAGLQLAKSVIQEAVVWPLLRPDMFTGLRRPPRGMLLFGPPGTGKTLIGKCIASQCNATFFSISASSLTSKWIGDGEKMVRALFAVARLHQPAVVFIDEIDSLLSQRSDAEHEATRRIKTEFLVQLDGAATGDDDRLLIVGATNRPQELDEAARRRLVKRLYIPLPDVHAREQIIRNLLKNENHNLSPSDMSSLARQTDGFSGADMKALCSEAAMGPIRCVPLSQMATIQCDKVRPVCVQDFTSALQRVRPSVSQADLGIYVHWNDTYGQGF